jgi:enoyl-CoA hydratase
MAAMTGTWHSATDVTEAWRRRISTRADLGSLQRLPGIIGKGHVAELAYTGKDITADRALSIGLVNLLSPDADAVVREARAMAAGTKAVLTAGEGSSVAEGLEYTATWNAGFLASDDLAEAMTAFMEKRPATFTGR